MHLEESTILELAPAHLTNLRQRRYGGDGMGVRLGDLPAGDVAGIRALYSALSRLLAELRTALRIRGPDLPEREEVSGGLPDLTESSVGVADAREVLRRTATDPAWRAAIMAARALAYPKNGAGDISLQRQALHDVRGGALAALALTLDLIAITDTSTADVVRAFYLTRDHLKIMRNALEDVDTEARERDRASRDHGAGLLFEKWSSAVHRLPGDRSARIEVHSTYRGPVSRRCLEFSALDRVLYNLMNNAVRFTADGVVSLHLQQIEGNLRFVVANEVASSQIAALQEDFRDDLGKLFLGGFTTGGEGVGLNICGEFVANAYGLSDVSTAVRERHVGAAIINSAFVAWFHWPKGD
jgi:signal transduction histidine kinase